MLSPGLQAISSTLVLEFLSLWLYSKVYLVENTSCIEFKKSSVPNNERSILDTIHRKKEQHEKMKREMLKAVLNAKRNNELKIDVFNKFTIPNFIYSKGI